MRAAIPILECRKFLPALLLPIRLSWADYSGSVNLIERIIIKQFV